MKKHLILLLVCVLWTGASYAQDLIVTTAGDSIFCKITRERDGYVYFNYIREGVPANTLIAADSVASKQTGLYKTRIKYAGQQSFPRWQYRFHGGYSRRIAKISNQVSPGMQEYLKKMRSGYTLGGDIHYYITEPFALGLKYNYNAYQYTVTNFEDRIKMHYIALSTHNRIIGRSGNEFLFGASLGYQSYLDKLNSSGTALNINGGTAGLGLELGYAIRLAESSKLFFNLALMTGTISKINVESGGRKETIKLDKNEMEGLGRLELTVGMHFGH